MTYYLLLETSEAQAIQWTQDALGEEQVAAVYTSIDTQIENQINPPIVTPHCLGLFNIKIGVYHG